MGNFASFIAECIKADDDVDHPLYKRTKPWAKLAKIVGQMIIGIATAVAVILVVVMRSGLLVSNSKALDASALNADELTAEIFAITAVGLAAAAALELAYTLFTPGPDEAIDPLLLGVSSTFLFLASKSDHLDWQFGVSAVLVVAALFGLFRLQAKFRQSYPDDDKDDSMFAVAEPNENAPSPEESAESSVARPTA